MQSCPLAPQRPCMHFCPGCCRSRGEAIWLLPTHVGALLHVPPPGNTHTNTVSSAKEAPDSPGCRPHHDLPPQSLAACGSAPQRLLVLQISCPAGLGAGLAPRGSLRAPHSLHPRCGAARQRRRLCRTLAGRQARIWAAVACGRVARPSRRRSHRRSNGKSSHAWSGSLPLALTLRCVPS